MLSNLGSAIKKRLFVILLAVITLAILFWVIKVFDEAPRTDDAYVYADTINVAPQVNGLIIDMPIKENQLVKKGDVLFRIDPRPYQDALTRATASLAQLEQQIILAQRDVNAQQFNAQAAEKRIDAARATAEQDANTLRRMEALRPQNYVSKEALDQARAAQRASTAQLQSAKLQAQQANAAVSSVAALMAQREVIKADISTAQFNVGHTVVKAPFNGRIASLKTTAGQYAGIGQAVFTLIDSNTWYVVANFRESELENIHDNARVDVYLMSHTGKTFSGVVDSIGYGVYPDDGGAIQSGLPNVSRNINWVRVAQRFPVRIRITTPDTGIFRMGTSAVVSIRSGEIVPHEQDKAL
ncbi:multidrug transporter subunit MdtN [Serratia ficaria]|jgi:multidrug efflux system membrane fusion protein|uniref:multidrug transporter subunit MdtN n=1 Tax=Serratia ficaria TaxID=61651 RepID=UPI002179FB5C|nr:multidrug transporter subunit MdtN [Serratia ficaria]MEE4482821.1 multidrug transporter subunit MdtN [Serratia ficaria]CAI1637353.1 Inner membrane protein yiaV precursor [Serratia ficaria]CAI2151316.1 Inner membrane protein yiaV precursor [Serratia ficaria]CAI2483862.1 Inner membrane protein yiaV precursor [Serratia ficaria]